MIEQEKNGTMFRFCKKRSAALTTLLSDPIKKIVYEKFSSLQGVCSLSLFHDYDYRRVKPQINEVARDQ